ncbi:acetoin utilization protein AcuC [Mariprofundus ferrinatatus]|uniref:Acetoin utilization protein AcuC n=1 Tax=Mariprofundus ferrinatatus TaxID=1921087 RepID=A0A2K8L9N1_9PROT|nr:acetoin utilization protein AcuC [Mariprofundus ferrinatatus]ATX80986.1 acetoin utilization protein AcuC [Mariprofundus ferrinatatus]
MNAPPIKPRVQLYIGPELARYGFGEGHPFGPDRMDAFFREAVRLGLDRRVDIAVPVIASRSGIERFHTNDYVERVIKQSASGVGYLDYGDTPAFKGVYEAAATVVGSVLAAADGMIKGTHRRCFVPIAGLHHARRDRAAGFCVFNDAGVLIETLRAVHGIRRIAYVDIDAHHGDGLFYAFEEDAGLCIVDLHEDGACLYPGTGFAYETGSGEAVGSKLNLPLSPGANDTDFARIWPQAERFVRDFQPEFIILQCGADSIAGDPITDLRLSPQSHAQAAASLCRIADEFAQGRLIALGGGGYNRKNLADGWCAVLSAMIES